MSTLLALMDYDVDCVCYSQYLSNRDFNYFKDFFIKLGIEKKIKYGTFNDICEKMINLKGDVREMSINLINGNNQ